MSTKPVTPKAAVAKVVPKPPEPVPPVEVENLSFKAKLVAKGEIESFPAVEPEKVAYFRPQRPTGPDPDGSLFRKWMAEDMIWKQHPDKVL